ncbi:MAG: 7-cyano-7-deazaguanine synthase [Campylobacterota bacterium]|nr:7-cyano-7-deazaguanine synthase [Campylobacterota bacterium]
MAKNKIGILFSGGLESTSLLNNYKKLNYNIIPLYIIYGYKWEETELIYAKKIAKFYNLNLNIIDYTNILNITQLGEVKSVKDNIIPLRNLSLLTFASLYFFKQNIYKIAIGLQGIEQYPDTSIDYIKNCEKLIQLGLENNSFKIEMPFYGQTKEEIYFNNQDIPLELIFSCTNPVKNKRCHKCYKCLVLNKLTKSV